jgi:hypothetical protein
MGELKSFYENVWQNRFSWLCKVDKRNVHNTLPFSCFLFPYFIFYFILLLIFSSSYFFLHLFSYFFFSSLPF